jgi:hypothetical protein
MATTKTTAKTQTKAQASKAQFPIVRYKNPEIVTPFGGRVEITPDGAGFRVTFIDRHGEQNERIATLSKALSYVKECGFTLETPPAKKATKEPAASPESVTAMMESAAASLTGALDNDSTRVCEKHGAVYVDYCAQCVAEQEAQEASARETFAAIQELQAIEAMQAAHPNLEQEVALAVAELQSTPPVEVATPVAATPEKPAKSAKAPKAEKPAEPTVEAYQIAPATSEIEKVAAVIREALGKKYSRDLNALIAETPAAYTGLRRHVAILGDVYGLKDLDEQIRAVVGDLTRFLDSGHVPASLIEYLVRYRTENVINLTAETYLTAKATGASAQTILEGYTLTLSTRTLADGSHYFERDYHRAK